MGALPVQQDWQKTVEKHQLLPGQDVQDARALLELFCSRSPRIPTCFKHLYKFSYMCLSWKYIESHGNSLNIADDFFAISFGVFGIDKSEVDLAVLTRRSFRPVKETNMLRWFNII